MSRVKAAGVNMHWRANPYSPLDFSNITEIPALATQKIDLKQCWGSAGVQPSLAGFHTYIVFTLDQRLLFILLTGNA